MKLSDEQRIQLLNLYFNGVSRYTDLAKLTGFPYNTINTFMTKWKRKSGTLKVRNKRIPKKVQMSIAERQELLFLRKFYKNYLEKTAKQSA